MTEDGSELLIRDVDGLIVDTMKRNPGLRDSTEIAQAVSTQTSVRDMRHLLFRTVEPYAVNKIQPQQTVLTVEQKLEACKYWWDKVLRQRVHCGTQYKFVRECTINDLRFCIKECQMRLEQPDVFGSCRLRDRIRRFELLVAVMCENKVNVVSDLPPVAVDLA